MLAILVKGCSHAEDLRDRNVGIRGDARQSPGKINYISLVGCRSHSKGIDGRSRADHRALETICFFELENIDQFSDSGDGAFSVTSQIFLQRDVDLVGCADESQKIILTFDAQLAADSKECQEFILSRAGVELLQFIAQGCDLFLAEISGLHRISKGFIILPVRIGCPCDHVPYSCHCADAGMDYRPKITPALYLNSEDLMSGLRCMGQIRQACLGLYQFC